jgi:hypothetical protein
MTGIFNPTPGSIVTSRHRQWVVLPHINQDLIRLRPLSGNEDEIVGIYQRLRDLGLEGIQPATFPLPESQQVEDHSAGLLLIDAARLLLRSGAGPFRCLGRLSLRPRPYQLVPLLMALKLQTASLLIADDVGIGKTIEAGLIARELLDRGEVKRIAVLCPPHLCEQWQQELSEKFHIDAVVVRSGTASKLERGIPNNDSIFSYYRHLIVSLDYAKAERRRASFITHCPDLVIVDEAHTCARPNKTTTSQQQRHQLITEIAKKQEQHLLLLTATPHRGIEESFLSLLGLLKPEFESFHLNNLTEQQRDQLASHFVQRRRADIKRWLGNETPFPERESKEEPYKLSKEYKDLFNNVYDFARSLVKTTTVEMSHAQRRGRYWSALALIRCVMSSPAAAIATLNRNSEFGMRNSKTDSELDEDLMGSYVYDSTEQEQVVDASPTKVVEQGILNSEPNYELRITNYKLKLAIRDVIQNCIYGVDLNPLAVDLCKVALWIEGFPGKLPLNFLDHRIKCGNSLVGVLNLDCLKEGIPDEAYKAVTGDDKKLSTQFKKRNKKERENEGQLFIDEKLEADSVDYAKMWQQLGAIAETTPQEVRSKEKRYKENLQEPSWWLQSSACNLWTTAFFMQLTEDNLQLFPTTEALNRLKREQVEKIYQSDDHYELRITNYELSKVVDAANKLAEEKRFFHWCLEFPEVFEAGGFDCVLGNPPWERIKLQEKEFFASCSTEIANAANKAAREKLIKELPKKNPELAQAWEEAKHDAEAQGKFIRESGRFPLTAVGDINTYAVFAETTRNLISPDGRVGVIVPTGIATDDTCKKFFGDLTKKQALAGLYDFENREAIFVAVHRSYKFSLLAISGKPIKRGNFAFFLTQPRQLDNQARLFQLTPQDIALLNPNTLTCPVFRTSADAELTKKIYQRVPVLENEQTSHNPWGVSFMRMFDMANDSGLFKNEARDGLIPLYEAKMFHQFDHRWATYTDRGDTRDLTDQEKGDASFSVQPRYWISQVEVENRLARKWQKDWLLGWRDICRATDERTVIASILPKSACGDTVLLMFPQVENKKLISCLFANLNNLTFDFAAKQKVAGTHLKFFTMRQLPIIPPEAYTPEDIEFISTRVLELVYTAWDMQPFAKDMGYDGEPFVWNPNRRALLRAEVDAYYAKLYGLTRDELRYILDPADVYGEDFPSETFRVLKNNEIKQFGEYRTQRLVLEAWDRIIRNS